MPDAELLQCYTCRHWKEPEGFHVHARCRAGRSTRCKPCVKRKAKEFKEANREHVNAQAVLNRKKKYAVRRLSEIKWKLKQYGLTLERYLEMLEEQGGGCAICGKTTDWGKLLHVDHDHATGVVRGLLCNQCNRGLGFYHDSPLKLRNAAEYLEARGY